MTDLGKDSAEQAVCLDGSDSGFYWLPAGREEDMDNFIIYLRGGEWCYDEDDCLARSKTELGSSVGWPQTITGPGGIGSSDCEISGEFCKYNKVYVKYCDGTSFTGTHLNPITVQGTPIYFRGKSILRGVLKTLSAKFNLSNAENVVLTSGAAGGISVFLHADYVHGELDPTNSGVPIFAAVPIHDRDLVDHDSTGCPI